jgi:uncharacterized protein (TIGR03118 family)
VNVVRRIPARVRTAATAVLLAAPLAAVPGAAAAGVTSQPVAPDQAGRVAISQVNLIADQPGAAAVTDPNVVNAWGLAIGPTSALWIANNGSDTATLASGGQGGATPTIPGLVVGTAGAPTGQVFNGGSQFVVTGPNGSGPARFLFDTESGDVLGWSPAAAPTTAIQVGHVDGAVYKGLAMASNEFGSFMLAADFGHGRIDVYDSTFRRTNLPAPMFTDRSLPRGYAPFNVDFLGGHVFVTYAKQGTGGAEVDGRGLGFVDEFSRFGQFERRIASRGGLNAPWGLEIAPASFGAIAGDLLVGNFGDGRINVFGLDGRARGQLRDANGKVLVIPGLWDLLAGTATAGGTDAVWFSSGPGGEEHGLVGLLRPAA